MALHASERPRQIGAELLELLAPRPGRLEYALRIALICALTALVAELYQTPDPALTTYIVFFLNKPDRVESLVLNGVMLMLISVIIGFTLLVTMVVIDAPLWRLVAMSLISFGLLFLASASKLRPLGATIALIIAYALDLLGTVQGGEIATRGLLYAWLFVGIPVGASVVINLLTAPPPRKLAERAIGERLRVAAALLREPNERTRIAFKECLREGTAEIQTWLKLAALEKTSPARDIAALRQAAQSVAAILSWIDAADRLAEEELPEGLREHHAQTLEDMAAILLDGGYPVDVALEPAPGLSVQAAKVWGHLREAIVHFAEPVLPGASDSPQAASTPPRAGFLLPDAFTNPDHVRYALKVTAAAMFCYVLYSLLDWPKIHTCFITCYIVGLTTTAETVQKLTLRILGCLVGAAAGIAAIVYVLPSLTSIQALLGVVFLGACASAWVAAGSPRISYAGFQIAFAFYLCVLQGPAPAFDLVTARDRIIGILIGNLAVYVVSTRLWPVSVSGRVDSAISALLRHLSAMLRTTSPATRHGLAAEAQASLGAIEGDLDLTAYEPASVRPHDGWLQARRRATTEIGALGAPLLLLSDENVGFKEDVARRLERLADRVADPNSPADAGRDGGRGSASIPGTFADPIGVHLHSLEDSLAPPTGGEGIASHAAT
jgi:multidrug resistance protein MdtO